MLKAKKHAPPGEAPFSVQKRPGNKKEAAKLLDERTVDTVWEGSYYHCVLNLIAAHTRMRLGEILGLTPAAIRKSELEVKHPWNGTPFGLRNTKRHASRTFPISRKVEEHPRALASKLADSGKWDPVKPEERSLTSAAGYGTCSRWSFRYS